MACMTNKTLGGRSLAQHASDGKKEPAYPAQQNNDARGLTQAARRTAVGDLGEQHGCYA